MKAIQSRIDDLYNKSWAGNQLRNIQKSKHSEIKCAALAGIFDSLIGLWPLIQKSITQAGPKATISKYGIAQYGIGFVLSNTSGHIASSVSPPSKPLKMAIPFMAATGPLMMEYFTRHHITKNPRTSALIIPLICRETCYWAGVSTSYNSNHHWMQSLGTQFLFSGLIANGFDTAAGLTSARSLKLNDLYQRIKSNPKTFQSIYRNSLRNRIVSAVLVP